jgi:anti-anti-sigma factor
MSLNNDPSSFRFITTFEGQNTVLALHGRVENLAAFELGGLLDSAIEQRPESVVLDLSGLEFMGSDGLVAVANAEKRLAGMGTKLTVRSSSAILNRLLGIAEVIDMSQFNDLDSERIHLGPEQLGDAIGSSHKRRPRGLTKELRKITGLPADPDVIDGALRLVVELARSCVHGADGVSVSLLRHGQLSTVAASDQTIMEMDANQYSTGEGPCIDASLQGHWFHSESLDTEARWPSFTPQARGLGIKAILSSPLKSFDEPVGALNIYSRTASSFDVEAQETAAAFAQKASVILSDARAGVSDTQMAARFQEALRSREVIAVAKGVIMEREGIDEDDAFTALLRLSMYNGISLRRRAEEIVQSVRHGAFGPEAESNE